MKKTARKRPAAREEAMEADIAEMNRMVDAFLEILRICQDAGDPAQRNGPPVPAETLCLVADVVDPITKEGYWLDPRGVGRRAESYLKFTGIADTVYFGPEAEFFLFQRRVPRTLLSLMPR